MVGLCYIQRWDCVKLIFHGDMEVWWNFLYIPSRQSVLQARRMFPLQIWASNDCLLRGDWLPLRPIKIEKNICSNTRLEHCIARYFIFSDKNSISEPGLLNVVYVTKYRDVTNTPYPSLIFYVELNRPLDGSTWLQPNLTEGFTFLILLTSLFWSACTSLSGHCTINITAH